MQGEGRVIELKLVEGQPAARIACARNLIPAPGRYALAHQEGSAAPLSAVLFLFGRGEDEFTCAPPIPDQWRPGSRLRMRGPLGNGFVLPTAAKRIALVSAARGTARLLPLVEAGLSRGASVTLVCAEPPEKMPLELEIQPLRALPEVFRWCDYAAAEVDRAHLPDFAMMLGEGAAIPLGTPAQVLVDVPMPCAALADCGVCTVKTRDGPRLACKDGPVFDLGSLILES